jgi:hypothetical protein
VFAKAINGDWPVEAEVHRREADICSPPVGRRTRRPAPRTFDDGDWIALVFDEIDGHEPAQPWIDAELTRVLSTLADHARAATPSPVTLLGGDQPRLGGWHDLADHAGRVARLPGLGLG